ncbi:S1C family serine protease [Croceicoccus mobilis]|uniref:Serine protease n=1 Tax=Croceicoccus mobilis TaxID=1703339 RepID=A0A917DPB3_9SPHN|nr:serine protease [Croceicoccus mobilis]GGD56210.1 hypothetical protein GCM10010990_01760 [Croceicoccus mobilis]
MTQAISGQRITLTGTSEILIRFAGRDASRLSVAAFTGSGALHPLDQMGTTDWRLSGCNHDKLEIVAYITDDKQGGFVNSAYPCTVTIDGTSYSFPEPVEQLAAVIIGEIYTKSGTVRMKVSNEGFTFGIDAYARARNLGDLPIPNRSRPRDNAPRPSPWGDNPSPDRSSPWGDPSPPPRGGAFASGSGVLIGPNLIVTNAHVIDGGNEFALGRTQQRLVPVAVDPMHDLALLQGQIQGEPLPIRINSPVWLGEAVMAAGYPLMEVLGADLKVTTGNVSGLTGGQGDVSRFQFSAPIGSGSSGGAIIDEEGNLIGITSASLAHQNFRDRGAISENVNFGIRAAIVFEMIAAAGMPLPTTAAQAGGNRRDVTNRLRNSVVSILVSA